MYNVYAHTRTHAHTRAYIYTRTHTHIHVTLENDNVLCELLTVHMERQWVYFIYK